MTHCISLGENIQISLGVPSVLRKGSCADSDLGGGLDRSLISDPSDSDYEVHSVNVT